MRRLHLAFVTLGDHSYPRLVVDELINLPAVFTAQRLGAPVLAVDDSVALATLGHNFSPFLGFRGGKGAATVLGISALMLWQLTAITVVFGGARYVSTRHAVWFMMGVFVLLNGLTVVTFHPLGQILRCLGLSFVVAGPNPGGSTRRSLWWCDRDSGKSS